MQTEFARKIVIVGGSAGGAGVAARLRRLNENAEILLIEKSRVISYSTCGIPYFIGNVIKDGERMRAHSSEEFSQLLSVDIRVRHEVVAIHRRSQSIDIRDLKTGKIYQEAYDKLVLALGSRPNTLDNKKRAKNVFVVRGYEETAIIKHYIHANSCRRAVIVGAGFIGVEIAENLSRLGMQVCLIDRSNQVLPQWDPEMSAVVRRHLKDKKISMLLNESLLAATENGVILKSGKKIRSDITILAMGVRPNAGLAAQCGLNIGRRGGIMVNSGLCTSDPNIYALGDAAEIRNQDTLLRSAAAFAGPAQKQARIVAENIAGRHATYRPGHASSIVKVFNLTVASTGLNEASLVAENIPYLKSYTESPSSATFYPGAQSMVTKLLFAPQSGKLLGAQIIGAAGVDKRIDVLATALHANFTVTDLAELNLSYAPPYSSSKDPVNVAGMVACNQLYDEDYKVLHWHQVDNAIAEGYLVVDVRTEDEFELRSLPGAINIPLETLRDRLEEIDKSRPILLYCGYGKKGYFALKMLKNYGFSKVYNLNGGLTVYSMAKIQFPSESTKHKKQVHLSAVPTSKNRNYLNKSAKSTAKVSQVKTTASKLDSVNMIDGYGGTDAGDLETELDELIPLDIEIDQFDYDDNEKFQNLPQQDSSQDWQESAAVSDEAEQSEDDAADDLEELDFDELVLEENIILQDQSGSKIDVAYIEVDATGLTCPGPIMKLAKTMRSANMGDVVQITATDSGFAHDIHNWCQKKGHKLLEFDDSSATIRAVLLKS